MAHYIKGLGRARSLIEAERILSQPPTQSAVHLALTRRPEREGQELRWATSSAPPCPAEGQKGQATTL